MEFSLRLIDDGIVNACLAPSHQTLVIELPQFVAISAEPFAIGDAVFVLEPNRDLVIGKRPQCQLPGNRASYFAVMLYEFSMPSAESTKFR